MHIAFRGRPTLSALGIGVALMGAATLGFAQERGRAELLVYGGDREFPPYEFLDADGRPAGFNVDLVAALADVMGRRIDVRLDTWATIRARLDAGTGVDIVGMYVTDERRERYRFTTPHTFVYHEVLARPGTLVVESLADLDHRRVAVQRNAFAASELRTAVPGAQPVLVATERDALQAVADGRADLCIVSGSTGRHATRDAEIDELVTAGAPIWPRPYALAVRRERQALVEALEQALATLRQDGRYRSIEQRWLDPLPAPAAPPSRWLPIALWALAAVVTLLVGVLAWNRLLGRRVASHTSALQRAFEERDAEHLRALESTARFEHVFADAPIGMGLFGSDGRIERANTALEVMLGTAAGGLTGADPAQLAHPDDRRALVETLGGLLAPDAGPTTIRARYLRADGESVPCEARVVPVTDDTGRRVAILAMVQDRSSLRQLEESIDAQQDELRQLRRIEPLGRLAGGIAHDFNNILTGILGFNQFVLRTLDPDDPRRADAEQVEAAAARAAELCRRLLAFSRRQVLEPTAIDLDQLLRDITKLVTKLLGEDVKLEVTPCVEVARVHADRSQIEQIVMNLAVNARDAMPDGGRLRISTAIVTNRPRPAGTDAWVRLRVADTGHGMDPATQARIFEPLFTTKPAGKGTGLGLSTVFGIVHQSGGQIEVRSTVGQGSTFDVFLPRLPADTTVDQAAVEAPRPPSDDGRCADALVLVAEDDDSTRALVERLLRNLRCRVSAHPNGAAALQAFQALQTGGERIDLLVSDLVMPEMSGDELAAQVLTAQPECPVAFMTGYADPDVQDRATKLAGGGLLRKPFTPRQFTDRVRALLSS